LKIERGKLIETLKELKGKGYKYLVKIAGVDNINSISVLYFVRDIDSNKEEVVEVELDPNDTALPSVEEVYKAADWYERTLYEMFGIEIKGRQIRRLLLEKWNGKGAPLRKNFEWGAPYETKQSKKAVA